MIPSFHTYELHVVRLPGAVPGRLELERREVELLQERPLDEGDILDVLERHGLLDLEDDALIENLGGTAARGR